MTLTVIHDYEHITVNRITPEAGAWLGLERAYNQLVVRFAGETGDQEANTALAAEVSDKLERAGLNVAATYVPPPGKHPAEDFLPTLLLILGVIGFFALFLSCFLIVNTVSAVLAQHTRQIGVMKAIGAKRSQVISRYLSMVLIYGVLSLLIAVPLGIVGSTMLSSFTAQLINFDINDASIPAYVYMVQLFVGLAVPVFAALFPVLGGTRTRFARR